MTDPKTPETEAIEALTTEVQRLNSHRFVRLQNRPLSLIWHNFLRGLAFGLGSALGATVLLSLLVWWLSQFEFLPILGEWAAELNAIIRQAQER